MKKLSKPSFEKAENWIKANARPLEIALIKYYFDDESSQRVIRALETFQNPDGGFGKAIEPDLRTPHSSVLGTSIAFQIVRSLEADNENDLFKLAIKFLLNNYNESTRSWRIIPPEAEKSPHAPWWNQIGREDDFNGFHLNPTAEILGYLYDYRDFVPSEMIRSLSSRVVTELKNLKEIEMHDFLCCNRLIESENLANTFKKEIESELSRLLDSCIVKDSSKWGGYGLRPLQVAESPNSVFFNKLQKLIEENLDYEIDTQENSGVWYPTWSWGDNYRVEWNSAKKEWTGVVTLEKLNLLRKFGRIEL